MSDDLELLDRWCAGDQDAGEKLFERYYVAIGQFFANKVEDDFEELVQTTFLTCMRRRDRFRRECSFRTFLFTIARYTLYDYLRDRARYRGRFDPNVTSVWDMATTPRSRIARQERQQLLLRALCQLPLESQLLLELHYWEQLGNADLAQVFEVAMPTVRTRLHRARQQLRKRMASLLARPDGEPPSVESLEEWVAALQGQRPSTPTGTPPR